VRAPAAWRQGEAAALRQEVNLLKERLEAAEVGPRPTIS